MRSLLSSTGGANSSTFHIYRSTRRAERDRQDVMTKEYTEEQESLEFKKILKENEVRDNARTEKNRKKRQKRKKLKRMKIKEAKIPKLSESSTSPKPLET